MSEGGLEPASMNRVRAEYGRVQDVITSLNSKMGSMLAKQESEFLEAYRAHMYNVQKELQDLRQKVSDAENSLQKNDKVIKLEEEREWYRREALRLDAYTTAMKKDLKFMREKLEVLEENRDWFADQLKASKKQNKLLLAELRILRRHEEFGEDGEDGEDEASRRSLERVDRTNRELDAVKRVPEKGQPASLTGGTGSTPKSQRRTPGGGSQKMVNSYSMPALRGTPQQNHSVFGNGPVSRAREKAAQRAAKSGTIKLPPFATSGALPPELVEATGSPSRQRASSRLAELELENTKLRSLYKNSQKYIQMQNRELLAARAKAVETRSNNQEMEDFLYRCVEEVRKEVVRRKRCTGAGGRPGTPDTRGSDAETVFQTIKQRVEAGVGLGLDDFTATDRKLLIARLLQKEEVLHAVLSSVFPREDEIEEEE
mmetsp:Transcript_44936/g.140750  ORF Transcript_44936/g.140750 Transcript_44936/m.140750 type:complete len:429 (-) Transcript_44936:192-1478(-)|eukprot:CAMPEP_0118872946 /NCGR_PEP_ID=MMETSP1163-20130328/14944_1 /TAXON_ID=124430 /ORGANISM="Phaeomonas parva, Strain CCMP2877" /LENGTH=428 /DNA_ID=CAMNT_0006808189 /DNA_START=198 /DNA_END=1484 /DNA_ORIENTATION=-